MTNVSCSFLCLLGIMRPMARGSDDLESCLLVLVDSCLFNPNPSFEYINKETGWTL